MNSSFPLVSIVIPVYNGSNYLRESIDSALAQTYGNIEILVINDGSIDEGATECIALSYGDRIRYFHKENGGVASALNYGIEQMRGEYFSWLSHDDLYTPEKIEKQIEALFLCEDKTIIVNCGYQVINSHGKLLYNMDPFDRFSKEQLERPLFALLRGCVHGCTLLIHKSHFERAGVFDINLPTTQDYDLWFRLMRGRAILYIKGLFVKSRSHDEQSSKTLLSAHIQECTHLWINMISSPSEAEKCQTDGTVYMFYNNTRSYLLEYTLYTDVITKLDELSLHAAKNEWLESGFDEHLKKELGAKIECAEYLRIDQLIRMKKKRPRIAFLLPLPSALGGLNKVVLQIAAQLCDFYELYLLSMYEDDKTGYLLDDRINHLVLPTINSNRRFLTKVLSLIEIDVCIISHNCDKYWLELYGYLRSIGIKSIAWNHEFYFLPYWNSALFDCLEIKNAALAQADAVIWLNSFSANAYALLHDNAVVMHNPVTIAPPKVLPDKRQKNIVAISRFDDPRKGFRELLYTFAEVAKHCPESSLFVLGSYDLDQPVVGEEDNITYAQLIKKLCLPKDRVIFIGWKEDIEEYLSSARVHLMPSKYEGFGLVITEAAAYGVPSVIFDGSGLDDIIKDGIDGRILPIGDIKGMANAVVELLQNDDFFNSISNSALKIANSFNMGIIVSRWRDLIETLLTKSGENLRACLADKFMLPVKNQDAFIRQLAAEYEMSVVKLASRRFVDVYDTSGYYKEECEKMRNTLSWRITKPLRLARKIQVYCMDHGLKATTKRIAEKLRSLRNKNVN